MISLTEFLDGIQQIVILAPLYSVGGTGYDGTCDCVGLVMGAMYRYGVTKFPLHSSNYFARKQMLTLDPVESVTLSPGFLVYKARQDRGDLHYRYKAGGQYYNGDLLDYYHVGVVTRVDPLEITHCTSTAGANGIRVDNTAKGWTHAGELKQVDYNNLEEGDFMATKAMVKTDDGNPLKMRSDPSKTQPYIAKIPSGDTVTVLASAQGWATVEWRGKHGYCVSDYLFPVGEESDEPMEEEAWEEILLEAVNALNDKMDELLSRVPPVEEGNG